jgi:hypothetical protein
MVCCGKIKENHGKKEVKYEIGNFNDGHHMDRRMDIDNIVLRFQNHWFV